MEPGEVDALDVRTLRALMDLPAASPAQSDIRRSLRQVARNIGVSESTVRDRVGRLRKIGFLRGWIPFFNPNLLGLRVSLILVDVNLPSKQAVVKKLQLLPGTSGIMNFFGSLAGMLVFYESPEAFKRELELIQRISESDNLVHSELRFPPSDVKLIRTDYRIMLGLLGGSQRSYGQVAAAAGLSARTVRRRINKLTKSRALFAIPSLDPRRLEGGILASLMVTYDGPEFKLRVDAAVRSQFADTLVSSQMGIVDRGAFLFCISNISKSRDIHSWAMEQPGVKSCRVDVVEEAIQRFDWLKELLQRRLAETARPVPMETAEVVRERA